MVNPTPRPLPSADVLPRALYTAAQVRDFDRLAIEHYDLPGEILMERAGTAVFSAIRERWPGLKRLAVLTGTGNNGGDGFVVARLASEAGLQACVLQLGERENLRGDALVNARRWSQLGGIWQPFDGIPDNAELVVDAMLGTGLQRDVCGEWLRAIEAVNGSGIPCVAVDLPSGLNSDTGTIMGAAIRAVATVSFIGLKQGMFTGDGPDCCGDILFDGLDVPAAVYRSSVLSARRIDWDKLRSLLPRRRRNTHKGHFGHVLVIGGNHGMGGAARLAAEAALRVGSGLVSLLTRPGHVAAILSARPEIMAVGVDPGEVPSDLLRRVDIIAVGPGLGADEWASALLQAAIDAGRPMVVDADALRGLATRTLRRDDWVLTPHPGEAAAMLGVCAAEVAADRFTIGHRLQQRYGGSVVLKGAGTLVHNADASPAAVCDGGNPGMASGGMGDALTGIIAGLLAQGLSPRDAAEAGVCLHAAAGDAAAVAGQRGLLASDLIAELRELVNQ
jgi:NAD(P)H-hydrate epimerase